MGKLGESQPTHRLHHLSQEPLDTLSRTRARTHPRKGTTILKPPQFSGAKHLSKLSQRVPQLKHTAYPSIRRVRVLARPLYVWGRQTIVRGKRRLWCFEHSKCSK